MKNKAAQPVQAPRPASRDDEMALHVRSLEVELEQKNVLLEQGFTAFTQAAEKLQDSHKKLQRQVAHLDLELAEKNRELEQNLVEKEKVKAYLSNIFESLPVGVFVMDLEGAVTSVNRAALEMIGLPAEELMGTKVNDVLGQALFDFGPGASPGGSETLEPDEPIAYHRGDGEALRLQVSFTPMEGDGATLGYILNLQDVTLLKRLEEQGERSNRFTAMGEMAANIAHEIRNPLGSIELFASLVKKGLDGNAEQLVLMNHISSGIASMNHVISNVLEYTRPRPASLKTLDLPRLLREIGEFSSYMAGQSGVEMVFDLPSGPVEIQGDEDLLKQVFHNLILNAVQAMTEGGKLTISAKPLSLAKPRQRARFEAAMGGAPAPFEVLQVGFEDTGPGIPKEARRKIFDPFFTTKSRGTGLGLAIVHHIIESHQATIDVESRRNRGTRFVFMFPRVPAPSRPHHQAGATALDPAGKRSSSKIET